MMDKVSDTQVSAQNRGANLGHPAAPNHLDAGQKKKMLRERIAMVGILRLGMPARERTSMPGSGGQGTESWRATEPI